MKGTKMAMLVVLAALASAFKPNEGPECKLTCRNRVDVEHCPGFHYGAGGLVPCTVTQNGCHDAYGDSCITTVHRPPLCAVTGPCNAGPTGCLDDTTGKDDGLPPGEYIGHCPVPQSLEQKCAECRMQCAMRNPPGGESFQRCMKRKCENKCGLPLLYKTQYTDAKVRCLQKGFEFGDSNFQDCVGKSLGETVPEYWRCGVQYLDTGLYCTGLNYTKGAFEYQGCLAKSLNQTCPEQDRCEEQFTEARTYCIDSGNPNGGLEFQKCISEQLTEFCPKDIACNRRHFDARDFCKMAGEKTYHFGSPDFQQCVAELLNPSCPKDFGCSLRNDDSRRYCTETKHLDQGSELYQKCLKEGLGDICPDLWLLNDAVSGQWAMDL